MEQELEEQIEKIKYGHGLLNQLITVYSKDSEELMISMATTNFYLRAALHEFCNKIEGGNFSIEEFYNNVSDYLGRPKEM